MKQFKILLVTLMLIVIGGWMGYCQPADISDSPVVIPMEHPANHTPGYWINEPAAQKISEIVQSYNQLQTDYDKLRGSYQIAYTGSLEWEQEYLKAKNKNNLWVAIGLSSTGVAILTIVLGALLN